MRLLSLFLSPEVKIRGKKVNTESETCMQQDNGISFEGNQGGNDPKKPPLCMNKEASKY